MPTTYQNMDINEMITQKVQHQPEPENDGPALAMVQIEIETVDIERMRTFYEFVLEMPASDSIGYMKTQDYRFRVPFGYLILKRSSRPEQTFSSKVQIVFTLGSEGKVNRLYERLKTNADCTVLAAPHFNESNRYQFRIADPEDNILVFTE